MAIDDSKPDDVDPNPKALEPCKEHGENCGIVRSVHKGDVYEMHTSQNVRFDENNGNNAIESNQAKKNKVTTKPDDADPKLKGPCPDGHTNCSIVRIGDYNYHKQSMEDHIKNHGGIAPPIDTTPGPTHPFIKSKGEVHKKSIHKPNVK